MTEQPKIFLTDEQWETLKRNERHRDREIMQHQNFLAEKVAEQTEHLKKQEDRREQDLRDMFAGQALVGLLSSRESQVAFYRDASAEGKDATDYISEAAYEMADAMLTARKAGA